MKVSFKIFLLGLGSLLVLSSLIFAGSVTTPSAPVPTMYTLTDIYNLIHEVAPASEGNHLLYPEISTTTISSHSISELYVDLANLIKRENLETGVVYLGVTGDYNNPDLDYATTTTTAFPSLTPVGSSGDVWGYTLDDIYELITNNTIAVEGEHDSLPGGAPADSLHSLADIYEALVNLIDPATVKDGVVYLGQTGTYVPITEFCGGDGSEGDPYQICYWTQLNNVRDHLDAYFILNNDLSSSDSDYAGLGDDWQPIGNCGPDNNCYAVEDNNPFAGSFNGNNKSISDLIINSPNQTGNGLFGYLGGNIYDLGILNININSLYDYTGAIAGFQLTGEINSCYSTGNIDGNYDVGGLVGQKDGGVISKSYSLVDVSGYSQVGGLVGWQNVGDISNSYFIGSVSSNSVSAGGLIGGTNGGTISKSYSTGLVSGSGVTIGGFIGDYSGGDITNSFWDIETSGQETSAGGTGTSTAAMQTQSTFENWDFDTIWSIDEGVDYPRLR